MSLHHLPSVTGDRPPIRILASCQAGSGGVWRDEMQRGHFAFRVSIQPPDTQSKRTARTQSRAHRDGNHRRIFAHTVQYKRVLCLFWTRVCGKKSRARPRIGTKPRHFVAPWPTYPCTLQVAQRQCSGAALHDACGNIDASTPHWLGRVLCNQKRKQLVDGINETPTSS